jgi:hypothetical protein
MLMRRVLELRRPRPIDGRERDLSRDAANVLAAFRFFAVAVVATLTVVIESRATQQTSLVVLATLAALLSLVAVSIGVRLVTMPRATYVLLSLDALFGVLGIL